MRIAFLGCKGIPGRHGVEVVVEEIASRLVELGHEVVVFGYHHYLGGRTEYRGCTLIPTRVPGNRFFEMPAGMKGSVKSLKRYPARVDVTHVHSVDPCLFIAPLAGHVPIVATSHGRAYRRSSVGRLRSLTSHIAERKFIQLPDVRTCVSPADTDYYNTTYEEKVVYIPNGMPALGRGQVEDLQKWKIERNRYILFSAGRLLPSKGLHTLFNAYEMLNTELPLVVIGGPSSDRRYYKELRRKAPEGTIFAGFISDESLWSLYRFPRLAVFPSEAEAQSMTLLEFLTLGLDVVYSDIPENRMVAGQLGTPFSTGSPESLAKAISHVLKQQSIQHTNTEIRRGLVETHNWDVIVQKYIRLYENAVSHHSRGEPE